MSSASDKYSLARAANHPKQAEPSRASPQHYRGVRHHVTIPYYAYAPMAVTERAHKQRNPLAHRIRALRHQTGITQQQAAEAAAIPRSTWQRWELGERVPRSASFPVIARALGIPLESLFCDDGYVPLATFVLSPDSLTRLTDPRTREATLDELHGVLSAQIRAELERAAPLAAPRSADVRKRRTREQLLAAQKTRLDALNARQRAKQGGRREIT